MTREHDTRIWRVVEHQVHAARDQLDCTGVRRVGVDETSARRGQDDVSIFADMHARRVLFATEGRCADTVASFAADLAEHGGDPTQITDTSSDMSTAFIAGIGQHLPNATMTFGSPGTDVDHPGDFSWGRSSSMGPQESMTRASAALAEWKP